MSSAALLGRAWTDYLETMYLDIKRRGRIALTGDQIGTDSDPMKEIEHEQPEQF